MRGLGNFLLQCGNRLFATFNMLQLLFQRSLPGQNRLNTPAVFFLETREQREAYIDLFQTLGIRAEALAISAQEERGLFGLGQPVTQERDHLVQAGIHPDQVTELRHQSPELIRDRTVTRSEYCFATGRRLVQPLRVHENGPFLP